MQRSNTRLTQMSADNTQTSDQQVGRLCWTRRELVRATGLSYRTIVNLEARGLLQRVALGINVVLYTDESVRALLGASVALAKEKTLNLEKP